MGKITKIIIKEEEKSIPKDFMLELADFTVITGENNTGKTNFIRAIDNKNVRFENQAGEDITKSVEVLYIPAEYILGDEEFKLGRSSPMMKVLKNLIKGNPYFQYKNDKDNHINEFDVLVNSVNNKIKEMLGADKGKNEVIEISIDKEISLEDILDSVLKFIPSDYSTGMKHSEFNELGQGWQRLIIAVFQLVLLDRSKLEDKIKLVLFEEPEAYLHSKFKRVLNNVLKEISSNENSQVLITTHDPYFAISNSGDSNNKVYTFERNNKGITFEKAGEISGIEDDFLYIMLFDRALKVKKMNLGIFANHLITQPGMQTKNYFWYKHPKGEKVALPIYVRNQIHHRSENKYNGNKNPIFTPEELTKSIKVLNGILK